MRVSSGVRRASPVLVAETADVSCATLTYRTGLVAEPTATFLHDVRPEDRDGLDGALDRALAQPTIKVPIRPAQDADWAELGALFRADHEEEDRKFGRPIRSQQRTDAVIEARRGLESPVQYFVAEAEGIIGFGAGWPGEGGVGLVEDLFVDPGHRRQGLAIALIGTAMRWARAAGAGPVVIGADPADTPKHLYARLGFIPTEMLRTATRPESKPAGNVRAKSGGTG